MTNKKLWMIIFGVPLVLYLIVTFGKSILRGDQDETDNDKRGIVQSDDFGEIEYSILRKRAYKDVFELEVLVSEDASKNDVMHLATALKDRCVNFKRVYVWVYDSEEAYQNRNNLGYPEEEYWKHFLVRAKKNDYKGTDEIMWLAEGRDH